MTEHRPFVVPLIVLGALGALTSLARAQDFDGGPRSWAKSSWWVRRQIAARFAITNVHVVDVATGAVRRDAHVVIRGDAIEAVGEGPAPELAGEVIDGAGGYLIPGLFDLHAHVIPKHPAFPSSLAPEETLTTLLDAGVTTVRVLPFFSESAHLWAARVNAGELQGPTIVTASSIFEQRPQRTSAGFGDPQTVRRWVLKEAALGTRWIKVYNAMDPASLTAIVETARGHGMRVCGHAQDVPPHEAARLGMHCIEHFTGFPRSIAVDPEAGSEARDMPTRVALGWRELDQDKVDALLATFREHGTAWVPTLVVGEAITLLGGHDGQGFGEHEHAEAFGRAVRSAARLAVRAHREGVLVGCGTDFPVDGVRAGESVQRELELLVEWGGATPLEALQIATTRSAAVLGLADHVGRIEPGMAADLVLLGADPLQDVSAVRQVRLVLHAGIARR